MSSLNKGVGKVGVALKWDPSPIGEPPHDLDIVAATYAADAPYGKPAYLVHFDSRSPDGTIILQRQSDDGQGFGDDELLTLEFARIGPSYARVVVGVVIQQRDGRTVFADVASPSVQVVEGPVQLAQDDFGDVPEATAATVAEFRRDEAGAWQFRSGVTGFDADPATFAQMMGSTSTS